MYSVTLSWLLIIIDSDPSLQVRACNLLGGYLTNKEPNMRYMSLETLSRLAISDLSREAVKKHQEVVLATLKVSLACISASRSFLNQVLPPS